MPHIHAYTQVKEYVPPAADAPDAPPTSLSLAQLKTEGEAKQTALEHWCRTAYGEVCAAGVVLQGRTTLRSTAARRVPEIIAAHSACRPFMAALYRQCIALMIDIDTLLELTKCGF